MQMNWMICALAIAVGVLMPLQVQAGSNGFLPYESKSSIDAGEQVYAEHCASCHGGNLEGEPNWRQRNADGLMPAPPHDETGHTWHHSDLVLFRITKLGVAAIVGEGYESNMPGFEETLSDQEILDVLGYIKSTWPDRIVEIQNARNN